MNVLSVFDGMGCGAQALKNVGVKFSYYSSEIDKWAMAISKHNQQDSIQIGDITKASYNEGVLYTDNGEHRVKFDIYMGGSPCQSISTMGDGSGLEGKSGLFYHWLRLRDEANPEWWLLENVRGNKKAIETITNLLGVDPVHICSSDFSAQKRSRLYWTNIPILPWEKKNIFLKDILDVEPNQEESVLKEGRLNWLLHGKGQDALEKRYVTIDPLKANCLTARSDASWNCNYVTGSDGIVRKLTVAEYEKLQTLPIGYTNVEGIPTREKYKMIGNGWTVDVISHILNGMLHS